ncbi:MAG: hypothetical protein AAF519_02490 [Bacteroidota bacterium]
MTSTILCPIKLQNLEKNPQFDWISGAGSVKTIGQINREISVIEFAVNQFQRYELEAGYYWFEFNQ